MKNKIPIDLIERLRSPWHHADCRGAADEIERLNAELAEWRKLRDPATLHVNLLRGLPAQLTREQCMHLAADDLQRMAELEAVARHEADCAEAYKAEAEALRSEVSRLKEHAVTLANTERHVERERCAKLCEARSLSLRMEGYSRPAIACDFCARAIRDLD